MLLTYFAKVILCSAVLYIYYYAALRNNRFHQWNRYYLVLITLLSLVTPLLKIPLSFASQESPSAVLSYTARIITLREAVAAPAADPTWYLRTGLYVIYALVVLVLFARLLASLFKIRKLIRRSEVKEIPPYRFARSEQVSAPFSFFRYIFWDMHTAVESKAGKQILHHELVHLREKHSADKLFMEVITTICWINPFFHLIKRELALIHEFIADKKAAGEEVAGYAETILQMTFQSKQFSITNDFFHPPIKRRIHMLTQFRQPKFSYLRRIMVLPLTAFIFCSLAFVADKRPSAIRALMPQNLVQTTFTAVANTTHPKKKTTGGKEVFSFVEHPPMFKGGEDSLAVYLSRNIRYPRLAQEKDIQGTVYIKFVVDADGSIKDVETVGKPKGGGLEEEGIRVVKAMPKWKPGIHKGKTVPVYFNLPIRFTLQEQKIPPADKSVAQQDEHNEVFTFVEEPPTYPGGEEGLARYLSTNIRYPKDAMEKKVSGTIFVQFIIDPNGQVKDVKTIGALKGAGLEDEAKRVVQAMPLWNPGKQNGRVVTVQFNIPIRFTLQS